MVIIFISLLNIGLSSEIHKNIDIIDSLSNNAYERFISKIKEKGLESLNSKFDENLPGYFKVNFQSKLFENDIEKEGDEVEVEILNYKPEYELLGDTLIRRIEFYIASNDLETYIRNFYNDTILVDDKNFIEDSEFTFDKAVLPPKKKSFFEKYLETIIIVASSLISVLLLFTVRSA